MTGRPGGLLPLRPVTGRRLPDGGVRLPGEHRAEGVEAQAKVAGSGRIDSEPRVNASYPRIRRLPVVS